MITNRQKGEPSHVSLNRPGGWEQLKLSPLTLRAPEPGEVRVRVRAAGVNFADVAVRLGLYESAKQLVGWPITPGFDLAGEVEEIGPPAPGAEPSPLKVGDRVFGVSFFGAYSTHVTLPARQLFPLPEGWSFERGAAFPTVHLTAWYALHPLAAARPGQRALVHSAAGGVGLALLQLCRAAGVETVGVVRGAHKLEAAHAAGAGALIDKGAESLWPALDRAAPEGFDLIFDANGYETLRGGYARLRPEGRLICFGAATMLRRGGGRAPWLRLAWRYLTRPRLDPLSMTSDNRSVMAFNLSFLFHRAELLRAAFAELLALTPPLQEQPRICFPLAEVARAHQHIESGESVGKLILCP